MKPEVTYPLKRLLHRLVTFKVDRFGEDSERCMVDTGERNERPASLADANIVSSLVKDAGRRVEGRSPRHIVAVDIDWPAHLIPSSTPGHSHLYVEIPSVPAEAYFDWLDACAKIGLVQMGYAEVARLRGHSDLRLPWVAKYASEGQEPPFEKPDDLDEVPSTILPAPLPAF